jgi:mannose-binding lectin 2
MHIPLSWTYNALSSILLALCAIHISAAEHVSENREDYRSVPLRTHCLEKPYLDSSMQSRMWDWGGDTIIRPDRHILFTSDMQHQAGWIASRLPITSTYWQLEWEFNIHGKGSLYGDGMAMWVTKNRATPGPVFGSADLFEGLGIFIDTYKNNRPGVVFPYVSAMLGDGNTHYDHAHDGRDSELAGCSVSLSKSNINHLELLLADFSRVDI